MTLYEIVVDSSYAGQSCINRWNYTGAGSPGSISGSQALMSALGFLPTGTGGTYSDNTLFRAIQNISATGVLFNQIVCKEIYTPTDFWTASFLPDTRGLVNVLGDAPFLAYGFRTNRTRSDIARGTKRFVGVNKDSDAGNGVIGDSFQDLLQIVAVKMTAAVTWDANDANITFTPAIVQKEKYDVPNTSPVKHAYRYYKPLSAQMPHVMQGIVWEIYTTMRSQTSRQYGKGQ